jgi:hypothetical protein
MFIQIVEIYHLLDSGTPLLGEKKKICDYTCTSFEGENNVV